MKKWLTLLVLAASVCNVVAARIHTRAEPLESDLTTYAIIAHELNHGALLYRDYWDNKPPAVFATYQLADAVWGEGPSEFLFLTLFFSLACGLGIFLAGWYAWPAEKNERRLAIATLGAALWSLLASNMHLQANQANTEVMLNAFSVLGFAAFLRYRASGKGIWIAALLFSVATLYKQVAIVLPAALCVFCVIDARVRKKSLREALTPCVWLVGTGALTWALTAAYFFATDRGPLFLATDFSYAFKYAKSPLGNLWMGSHGRFLIPPFFEWASLPLAAVGAFAIWKMFRLPSWGVFLAYFLAVPTEVALPGQFLAHYYQLWLPVLAIGGAWIARSKPGWLITAMIAFVSLWFQIRYYAMTPDQISLLKYSDVFTRGRDLGVRLGKRLQPQDTLFVWGSNPGIYYYSEKRPPTSILWASHLERDPSTGDRLMRDLALNPPALIETDDKPGKVAYLPLRNLIAEQYEYISAESDPGYSIFGKRNAAH